MLILCRTVLLSKKIVAITQRIVLITCLLTWDVQHNLKQLNEAIIISYILRNVNKFKTFAPTLFIIARFRLWPMVHSSNVSALANHNHPQTAQIINTPTAKYNIKHCVAYISLFSPLYRLNAICRCWLKNLCCDATLIFF